MELNVVLVEPKYSGNIGACARAMKNFGFQNLVLINPCPLDEECYQRAMHAEDVVKAAKTYSSLEDFLKNIQLVVGTSGILNLNEKAYIRNPLSPRELSERLAGTGESAALLFGREDYGLLRTELTLCDMVVSIPTSKEYPIMNLSHSVAVMLYELSRADLNVPQARGMTKVEKEKFFEYFDKLLENIDYPDFKVENTRVLFRRLVGRSMPTAWEFHTLMGILVRAVEYAETAKPLMKKEEDEQK